MTARLFALRHRRTSTSASNMIIPKVYFRVLNCQIFGRKRQDGVSHLLSINS
jgi:hypothetical protein